MKKIILKIKNSLFSSNLEREKQNTNDLKTVCKDENNKEFTQEIKNEQEVFELDKGYSKKERERGFDEVYNARLSGNLDEMLQVSDLKTTLINRHFLLQGIISQTYKLRNAERFNNLCIEYCEKHLSELPILMEALQNEYGELPRILVFQIYSTVLTEIGEYEKAINICEMAISFGLDDGTKGGYLGRIAKIKKKIKIKS
ncbi:hypothetical protein [Flavobacterium alvei]|nr:hypothetical protein [Flavobacterium alvei]